MGEGISQHNKNLNIFHILSMILNIHNKPLFMIGLAVWRFAGVTYFKHEKPKFAIRYNIKETIVMSPRCVPYVMKSVLPVSS